MTVRRADDGGWYHSHGKRVLDACAGSVFLVVTLPIQAVLAVLVRRRLGRPVLFRQERPGLHGREFTLAKFRSMTDARDDFDAPRSDAERLTPFGRRLRSTSLDELPEILSVVKGDMSLVGPRPLLTQYLPLYNSDQARRHDVRPGLTGWAQVNGRNALTWEEKFRLDTWYVDHVSFGLDMRILWRTLRAVVSRDGVSADGDETMPVFEGSPDD
jgi:lipopolysaccharide/colanic/teichoic acid biosynthesis glycosyltransferase